MEISVVTPSLNMLPYLKCCTASIADQQGAAVEHIVVDGNSHDGTVSWLAAKPEILSLSEKDKGMYDAVNKGLRLAHGDILAYLNCDEQYLPGTLSFVKSLFAAHPSIDILFGDFLVTRPDGSLIAFRKSFAPRRAYIYASYLYTFTCTMFFRRRIIDGGFWFNPELRIAGDAEWLLRVLKNGFRAGHRGVYFSIFTDSGQNASRGKVALAKARGEYCGGMPAWLKYNRYLVNGVRIMEKILRGNYWQIPPLAYDIYTPADAARRTHFAQQKESFRWRNG
ncbi:MAG: glycosyltransferase [Candidatus Aminicenantes bacterium]|nr:glycosyltransferase [Acidobacteriota bacterium]MCG2811116.1 glycosyltransferase [Candidatus Aminicenantes bacterium]